MSKCDKNDLEPYLTSSPAKSNTLVMVTLAGSDALVSILNGATFNTEESSWGYKQENQPKGETKNIYTYTKYLGLVINAMMIWVILLFHILIYCKLDPKSVVRWTCLQQTNNHFVCLGFIPYISGFRTWHPVNVSFWNMVSCDFTRQSPESIGTFQVFTF